MTSVAPSWKPASSQPVLRMPAFFAGVSGDAASSVLISQKDKIYTLVRSDNDTLGGDLISNLDFNSGTIGVEAMELMTLGGEVDARKLN
jgi:hypothetical protein